MKTILSILLLPILMIAQPRTFDETDYFDLAFSTAHDMESILEEGLSVTENLEGTFELFITGEVYLEELFIETIMPQQISWGKVINTPPQYLDTFSLLGSSFFEDESTKPQERLDGLLALNDPRYPKENTLSDWLRPVRYQQNKMGGAENMPEGFGPRIRL